jgi:hypothetical protein
MAIATRCGVTPRSLLIRNPIAKATAIYATNGNGDKYQTPNTIVIGIHNMHSNTMNAGAKGRQYGRTLCLANVEALHIP